VDITLAYWVAYIDADLVRERFPAITVCVKLTMERPGLRGKFAQLRVEIDEYAQMQACSQGVV
jgi:hypothetical protein